MKEKPRRRPARRPETDDVSGRRALELRGENFGNLAKLLVTGELVFNHELLGDLRRPAQTDKE